MSKFTLPENAKIVEALAPAADAAGRDASKAVSLKNYGKAWIVVHLTQGNAATVALTPMQATAVAKTGGKVLTNNTRIWANADTSTSDTLVRQTDAKNFTTDAGTKNKVVIFEINPDDLDVANGFDCVYVSTGASNAANITQAMYVLSDPRYAMSTPPSAIVD